MQAVQTTYHAATNHIPTRAQRGGIFISASGYEDTAHQMAAQALCDKFWRKTGHPKPKIHGLARA